MDIQDHWVKHLTNNSFTNPEKDVLTKGLNSAQLLHNSNHPLNLQYGITIFQWQTEKLKPLLLTLHHRKGRQ